MKKALILLPFVICFYSLVSQAQNTTEYMTISMTYKGIKTNLYVIDENGKMEERRLKSIATGFGISADKVAGIQVEVQAVINELAEQGWKLSSISNLNLENFLIVNYYLERPRE